MDLMVMGWWNLLVPGSENSFGFLSMGKIVLVRPIIHYLYHEDFLNFTYLARNCNPFYNIWNKVEYEIPSLY